MITLSLILPHQEGGKFFRELDAPQLCCGVLHFDLFTFIIIPSELLQERTIRGPGTKGCVKSGKAKHKFQFENYPIVLKAARIQILKGNWRIA